MNKTTKFMITAACMAVMSVSAQAKLMESSVATVNGRPVLASEYDSYLESVVEQYKAAAPEFLQQPYAVDRLGHEVLNELISKELLYQAADEAKVVVKDSEIDAGINEIKSRFIVDETTGKEDPKGADKRFNAALKKQGMTLKRYKEKIKKDVAVRKLMEEKLRETVKPVEEADAKELYDRVDAVLKNDTKKLKALEKENPLQLQEAQVIASKLKQLTAEKVRIGHIYLATTQDMKPEEIKKKEELAKQIKKEIDGGLDFSAAVKKYTEDPAAITTGGDMILIQGIAPEAIDKEVFGTAKTSGLAVGKVSKPIKSDVGFHIVKVKEKSAAKTVTFDDIKGDLGQYLAQQRVQAAMLAYIESLYEKADIKVTKTFELDEVLKAQAEAQAKAEQADKTKSEKSSDVAAKEKPKAEKADKTKSEKSGDVAAAEKPKTESAKK